MKSSGFTRSSIYIYIYDISRLRVKVFCDILGIKLCTDCFNFCFYFDALVYFDVLGFMLGLPFYVRPTVCIGKPGKLFGDWLSPAVP
jgi:hypothetical protein